MVLNIEKKLSRINLLQYNGSFAWKNFIRNKRKQAFLNPVAKFLNDIKN